MTGKSPLVLVPGLLCDQWLWRYQIDELSDIADIMVADTTQDESLDEMADRLLSLSPTALPWRGFRWVVMWLSQS